MGKLSFVRMWRGTIKDGDVLNGEKVSGIYRPLGAKLDKVPSASQGEIVAFGRMDPIQTGDVLTTSGGVPEPGLSWPAPQPPVYAVAERVPDRNDEVQVAGALAKLCEEAPALTVTHAADLGRTVLLGAGDPHRN